MEINAQLISRRPRPKQEFQFLQHSIVLQSNFIVVMQVQTGELVFDHDLECGCLTVCLTDGYLGFDDEIDSPKSTEIAFVPFAFLECSFRFAVLSDTELILKYVGVVEQGVRNILVDADPIGLELTQSGLRIIK